MYTYIYKSWRPKPDDRITSWRAVFLCVWGLFVPVFDPTEPDYRSVKKVMERIWVPPQYNGVSLAIGFVVCDRCHCNCNFVRLRVCVFHFVSIGCFLHTYTIYIYSGVYIISTTPFYLYADTYIKCSCVYYKKGWWVWDTDRTCSHGS